MIKTPIAYLYTISHKIVGTTGYPEAGVGGKQLGDPKYGEVHNNVPVSIEEFDFEYGEEYNKGTIQIRSSTLKTADNIALQLYVPLILKWGYITEKGLVLNKGEKVVITEIKWKYDKKGIIGTITLQDYLYYISMAKENPVSYEDEAIALGLEVSAPVNDITPVYARPQTIIPPNLVSGIYMDDVGNVILTYAGGLSERQKKTLDYRVYPTGIIDGKSGVTLQQYNKALLEGGNYMVKANQFLEKVNKLGKDLVHYDLNDVASDYWALLFGDWKLNPFSTTLPVVIYQKTLKPDELSIDYTLFLKEQGLGPYLRKWGIDLDDGPKEIHIDGESFSYQAKKLEEAPVKTYNLTQENEIVSLEFNTKDQKNDASIDSITTVDPDTLTTKVIQNISIDLYEWGEDLISEERAHKFLDTYIAWMEAGGVGSPPHLYATVPNLKIDNTTGAKVYITTDKKDTSNGKVGDNIIFDNNQIETTAFKAFIPSATFPVQVDSYPAKVISELQSRLDNEKLNNSLKKFHINMEIEGDPFLKINVNIGLFA